MLQTATSGPFLAQDQDVLGEDQDVCGEGNRDELRVVVMAFILALIQVLRDELDRLI